MILFLQTDDFWRDYDEMRGRGIRFAEEPRIEELWDRRRFPRPVRQPLGTWWNDAPQVGLRIGSS